MDGLARLTELRHRLVRAMDDRGDWPTDSPWVRDAMEAVPRHLFAPDRVWEWDGWEYVPVDRRADPGRWAALVHPEPDEPTITQVTDGWATSSLSCPSIVADMLDSLMLQPDHHVLELGTGTGWNAGLLAAGTGPGRVTSVDIDPGLASAARERLDAVGAGVAVHTGDGALGAPGAAGGAPPYDRVVATYAVDRIPWPWVEQTRPGGRIVTPWGRLGHVALTVADDGRSASGWMQGLAMFMPSRGYDQGRPWDRVRGAGPPEAEEPLALDVRALHTDRDLLFALRVLLPDIRITTTTAAPGAPLTARLHDGHSSWATLAASGVTHRGGPRHLPDEAARATTHWQAAGAPGLYDFGLTRTPDQQYIWSGDKDTGPRW
ncbi:methyltransferase domain-containing protein [Streptomyces sp. NPDC087850]|uniref:methyltransferase domain-containing protein n=1 Tax=Streptomyces sp. NPDC087850 TaxID=3365809 RepID=UPI003802A354